MTFKEEYIDHVKNPRNVGKLEDATIIFESIYTPAGDKIKLYLKITENVLDDISFETFGCATLIVSASIMTTHVKGMSLSEALNYSFDNMAHVFSEIPRYKLYNAKFPIYTLHRAINAYLRSRPSH
ncbi:MAG: putative Fe-S cluster assembly scaffold protein NifU [Promethearchaeota archaeon]|nr:MAG: putative Fe-S cluster assembly scaffold protein NifU [Candidatus Lokiarchaeota archaeon]